MCENYRVRRGMIFRFDFDPDVDKYNVPPINLNGKIYPDRLMYGERPYLVVSSNTVNESGYIAQIVPIHSHPKNKNNPLWVYTDINCKDAAIMCDQVRSVNLIELQDYRLTLPDSVMEEVDKVLMKVLGFDSVIESIKKALVKSYDIDKKAESIFKCAFSLKEIENPNTIVYQPSKKEDYLEPHSNMKEFSIRLSNLEKRFGNSNESNSKEDKEVGKRKRRTWSDEEVLEFINDDEEHDAEYMIQKYGCKNKKVLYNLRCRLKKRFEG